MRHLRTTRLALVATLALCFSFAVAQGDDAEAREVVEGVKQRWMDTISQQDAAAMAQLFTEDGQLFTEGGLNEGREALEETFRAFFDSGGLAESSVSVSETWLIGETAFAVGEYSNHDSQGELSEGSFLEIFKQEDGEWKIYRLMATAGSMPDTMTGGGN